MNAFEISHLAKKFQEKTVLRDISLAIAPGEVVAVIGPSGGGKTTFLRCAALLETMDAGNLSYGDLQVVKEGIYADKKVQNKARGKFGLVFQNFNLFPHLSVLENLIDPPLTVHHRPKAETVAEAKQLLDDFGLTERMHAYPGELSGGQQQRVSIARAMMLHPSILFFDEPTSALDPELTGEVLKIIRALAAKRMTMLIVTHEIEFAAQVADRIVFIADGLVVEEGPARELVTHPKQERTRAFLSGLSRI